ncbi:MAG: PAS domain-containing protein [Oligoflexia bacterium]|nr:PAS domain-containing protein [Oligoflexia bacterium]
MTTGTDVLKSLILTLKPAIEASLDAVAIVDARNQVVYCNVAMKSFLGLKQKDLARHPVFCELVKISACEGDCQLLAAIRRGSALHLDEVPAAKGKGSQAEKIRISLRAVPLHSEGGKGEVVGAVVSLRDATAEIVLQAKYHKLMEIVAERNEKIYQLDEQVKVLRGALRKARVNAIT